MADVSNMMVMATQMLENLPQILQAAQIVVYFFLILFFGSIASKGYRAYPGPLLKIILRLGSGFLCLLAGISLADFMPYVNEGIFRMFQLHVIVSGIVASVVFFIAFYLMTKRLPKGCIKNIRKRIEKLQNAIREIDRQPEGPDPLKIIALVIIIVFLVVALMNFRGFPSFGDEIFSSLGVSPDELSDITSTVGDLPQDFSAECNDLLMIIYQHMSEMKSTTYSDPAIKSMVEVETGATVVQIFRAEYMGNVIFMAMLDNGETCYTTSKEVCVCVKI